MGISLFLIITYPQTIFHRQKTWYTYFYGMPQELRDETLKRLPEDIREAYELLCFMIAKMI